MGAVAVNPVSEIHIEKHKAGNPVTDTTPLRFITCGSVDDGKSTLIGRLLWDTKAVPDDQIEAAGGSGEVPSDGFNLPDFANLLDGLQAEREQGITIDVAYRYFSTSKRSFIAADTPGHIQYTRNMATGASTADLAVLLVDARTGILEQTRRHASIASLMGISELVLVVNKIDLIDYDEARFRDIVEQFETFAGQFDFRKITAIPTSALKGENVVIPAHENIGWYDGQTLLETLELATGATAQSVGFRFPVQRVCRPDESFRGYQGTIAGGAVKPGDSVIILPSGETANVDKIVTFDLVRNAGVAGDAVTLVLDRPVDISRGDLIASVDARGTIGRAFDAKVISLADGGLEPGKRYWLKSGSRRQWVTLGIKSVLDLKSQKWLKADDLAVNGIAKIVLSFDELAMFDSYADNRDTGSFILIDPDTNNTIAGGMITGQTDTVTPLCASDDDGLTVVVMPSSLAEKLQGSITQDGQSDQVRSFKGSTLLVEGLLKTLEQLD